MINSIVTNGVRLYQYFKKMYAENTVPLNFLYLLHETYRNEDGSYMIVAKIIGSTRGVFKISATELVSKRRDILVGFSPSDIVNIVGLATTDKATTVIEKKTNDSKYFALLAMIFGCALVTSNITSSKLIQFLGTNLTGGTLPYLITYSLGGIITEVYGFKRTRQLIWGAIVCNIFAVVFIYLSIICPPSPTWTLQSQYASILGAVPGVMIASMFSYFCGEFLNSYVMAKLKILYNGDRIVFRIIFSSIIGMTVDNYMFIFMTYFNSLPFLEILKLSGRSYIIGLVFEWLSIPMIIFISSKLKSIDHIDIFDIDTNFTPFSLDVDYKKENNQLKKEAA